MDYALFLLLITEMCNVMTEGGLPPDIGLNGKFFKHNSSTAIQFICSTNIAVLHCTVEFMIEKRTYDVIRKVNNTCYHKEFTCSPSMCACSGDCRSFSLNISVTQDMMNHSFSCESRIETNGATYLANALVKLDGKNRLILLKKIIVPITSVSFSQMATTSAPERNSDSLTSVHLILIAIGSSSCFLCIIVLIHQCCLRFDSKRFTAAANSSGRSSPKPEIKNEDHDKGRQRLSIASSVSNSRSIELMINKTDLDESQFHYAKVQSSYI